MRIRNKFSRTTWLYAGIVLLALVATAWNATGQNASERFRTIPHEKFEDIRDSRGNKLDGYKVYANFVDFHAPLNDFFPRSISWGKGIQDIKRIGEAIVHASAYQTSPINLGKGIKAGSNFRNGKVILAFKGLSIGERPG